MIKEELLPVESIQIFKLFPNISNLRDNRLNVQILGTKLDIILGRGEIPV